MSKDTMWVRIDGEPFQSRALAYRAERKAAIAAWNVFRESVGALNAKKHGIFQFSGGPKDRRDEWAKAGNRRTDWWQAKKNTALAAEISALPRFPDTSAIFGDTLMTDYCYETPDGCSGAGGIGLFFEGPTVGWHEDTFICGIPDPAPTLKSIREQYPEAKFTNGCDLWTLPAGLARMTEAEMELFFAQARVEAERVGRAA